MSVDELIADERIGVVIIATSHSSHAELTARALKAGKHVFCEKPLALSQEEIDIVLDAWESSGRALAVGYNRRYSDAISQTRRILGAAAGSLVITYRVNAGRLPPSHWYNDRTQGGRLLGEVCHFIDTCESIVGAEATLVSAQGSGHNERLLSKNLIVSLAYGDGSLAAITYGDDGGPGTSKERIEILGRGHTICIDDFRTMTADGRNQKIQRDKGHVAQLRIFREKILSERDPSICDGLASTMTTLRAAEQLGHPSTSP
jgi:predicted dehydrogenase